MLPFTPGSAPGLMTPLTVARPPSIRIGALSAPKNPGAAFAVLTKAKGTMSSAPHTSWHACNIVGFKLPASRLTTCGSAAGRAHRSTVIRRSPAGLLQPLVRQRALRIDLGIPKVKLLAPAPWPSERRVAGQVSTRGETSNGMPLPAAAL